MFQDSIAITHILEARSPKFNNIKLSEYIDKIYTTTGKYFISYSKEEQFELLCNFFDKFGSMNSSINAPNKIIP